MPAARTLRPLVLAGMLIPLLVAGCGHAASRGPATGGHRPRPVVLDQRGRGFSPTRLFEVNPQRAWGVAYAYDCGVRAADFAGDVWEVVNAVELPYTIFSDHGTHGRGLRMETGSTSTINAPNGSSAGRVLGLRIKTACAWHVRVITGPQKVVARHVPTHV